MPEVDDAGILEEINALVSYKFQVVSYKWLSRNFLVSSDVAKRLLNEFVDKQKTGFEILYALAGWLKGGPKTYHVRLVSGSALSEAKQEFEGDYSLHIYSVQPSVPEYPVALWNTEFIQAEELFKQIPTAPNCLRDNRFCGVSNTMIKRNSLHSEPIIEQKPVVNGNLQKQQHHKINSNSSKVSNPINNHEVDKEKPISVHFETKCPNNGGGSTGAAGGSSLGDLWSRASVRPKPNITDADKIDPNPNDKGVEDAAGDSESEGRGVTSFKRCRNGVENGRKRKVLMDFTDEELEDTVDLNSPGLAKTNDGKEVGFGEGESGKKEGGESLRCCTLFSREEERLEPEEGPNNTRKKKINKWVDERGREVSEVVWEGEEDVKKGIKREVVVGGEEKKKKKKADLVGRGGGKKKSNGKEGKQGNIMSFFNKL